MFWKKLFACIDILIDLALLFVVPFVVSCFKFDVWLSFLFWVVGMVSDFYTTYMFYLEGVGEFFRRERSPLLRWAAKKFSLSWGFLAVIIVEFFIAVPMFALFLRLFL